MVWTGATDGEKITFYWLEWANAVECNHCFPLWQKGRIQKSEVEKSKEMKKKSIFIVMIMIVVAAISIYLLTRPKALGSMSHSDSEQTTTASDISFHGEAGEKIKFSFQSNIKHGDLDIVLYDSAGNEVYALDQAKALETFFVLERSDTYTLAAECNNVIGNYKICVYPID